MPGPRIGTRVRRELLRAVTAVATSSSLLLVAIGAVTMPSMLLLWAVLGAVTGGGVYAVMRVPSGRPHAVDALRRAGVLAGVLAVGACLLLAGLVSLMGAAAGPLILFLVLLLASLPVTWRALGRLLEELAGKTPTITAVSRRATRDRRGGAVHAASVPVVPIPVTELLTPALCLAWRRSYLVLLDTPDGPGRHDLAAARRQMLDELERRDGAGFASWMAAGARAGSDPGRYLTSDR